MTLLLAHHAIAYDGILPKAYLGRWLLSHTGSGSALDPENLKGVPRIIRLARMFPHGSFQEGRLAYKAYEPFILSIGPQEFVKYICMSDARYYSLDEIKDIHDYLKTCHKEYLPLTPRVFLDAPQKHIRVAASWNYRYELSERGQRVWH